MRRLPVFVAGVVFAACAAPTEGAETSDSEIVNQRSPDVTVLKAEALDPIGGYGSADFRADECGPGEQDYTRNCTAAMEKRYAAPALHAADISKTQFFCRLLRVTTATRTAALGAASGIGFYYRGYGGSGRFIPKAELKKIGEATLKSGEPVVLHEFVGLANCWLGSSNSSYSARYEFKPYARFETPAETYLNWDESDDYTVTVTHDRFDRSSDLLR